MSHDDDPEGFAPLIPSVRHDMSQKKRALEDASGMTRRPVTRPYYDSVDMLKELPEALPDHGMSARNVQCTIEDQHVSRQRRNRPRRKTRAEREGS